MTARRPAAAWTRSTAGLAAAAEQINKAVHSCKRARSQPGMP
jgi:hypothetical protein